MKFIKFITYYNGVVKVKYTRVFDRMEYNPPSHLDLVIELKKLGVQSCQIMSCGIANIDEHNKIRIIEDTHTGNVKVEDMTRDAIKRGKKTEDCTQKLLFEKER